MIYVKPLSYVDVQITDLRQMSGATEPLLCHAAEVAYVEFYKAIVAAPLLQWPKWNH